MRRTALPASGGDVSPSGLPTITGLESTRYFTLSPCEPHQGAGAAGAALAHNKRPRPVVSIYRPGLSL